LSFFPGANWAYGLPYRLIWSYYSPLPSLCNAFLGLCPCASCHVVSSFLNLAHYTPDSSSLLYPNKQLQGTVFLPQPLPSFAMTTDSIPFFTRRSSLSPTRTISGQPSKRGFSLSWTVLPQYLLGRGFRRPSFRGLSSFPVHSLFFVIFADFALPHTFFSPF